MAKKVFQSYWISGIPVNRPDIADTSTNAKGHGSLNPWPLIRFDRHGRLLPVAFRAS